MSLKKCHNIADADMMIDHGEYSAHDVFELWVDREKKIEQIAKLKQQFEDDLWDLL